MLDKWLPPIDYRRPATTSGCARPAAGAGRARSEEGELGGESGKGGRSKWACCNRVFVEVGTPRRHETIGINGRRIRLAMTPCSTKDEPARKCSSGVVSTSR